MRLRCVACCVHQLQELQELTQPKKSVQRLAPSSLLMWGRDSRNPILPWPLDQPHVGAVCTAPDSSCSTLNSRTHCLACSHCHLCHHMHFVWKNVVSVVNVMPIIMPIAMPCLLAMRCNGCCHLAAGTLGLRPAKKEGSKPDAAIPAGVQPSTSAAAAESATGECCTHCSQFVLLKLKQQFVWPLNRLFA